MICYMCVYCYHVIITFFFFFFLKLVKFNKKILNCYMIVHYKYLCQMLVATSYDYEAMTILFR